MEVNLHQEFISTLSAYYGMWHKVTSKFGTHSFGEISDELCVSASQFSKLIAGTATEGMYIRSIRNLQQLKHYHELELENQKIKLLLDHSDQMIASNKRSPLFIILPIVALTLGCIIIFFIFNNFLSQNTSSAQNEASSLFKHPLSIFFDQNFNSDFVSPYLYENEIHEYCPCNAYEGTWRLESDYKIPLPVKKSGVYYVAKSSDIRLKCLRTAPKAEKGKLLIGFENMVHEIWVDRNKNAFDKEYFDASTKEFTKGFIDLKFAENERFSKVAVIHSFFFDQIRICNDSIYRKGEPCGRYVEITNQELANEYELDFKNLLKNIIGNMTFTDCDAAFNPYCNPNDLIENESVISFDCRYTIKTENLGIGGAYPYTKGFRLIKQNYSDRVLCSCPK